MVAAIELARAGLAVTLVDSGLVGSGATGRSIGVLSTPAAAAGFGPPDDIVAGRTRRAWHRDRLAAQRYLLQLLAESGKDCDLQQGVVLLAPTDRNLRDLAATVHGRNEYYGTHDHIVDRAALAEEAGGRVTDCFAGGLVMSEAHHANPARMIAALADLAESLGATICEATSVQSLARTRAGFLARTAMGETRADDVLLATGGYTGEQLPYLRARTLGLPSAMAATELLPTDFVKAICRSGRVLLVNRFRTWGCRPSPDGRRILLAGPVGEATHDATTDLARLRRYFARLFPALTHVAFSHCWTGLIAATPDAKGHAGRHGGAWYTVGASGIVSCADAGYRIAQQILHGEERAGAVDSGFPRWWWRDRENMLRGGVTWSTRLLDLVGRSRLR